jgi:glucose/arabinose dehydrogenase
MAEATYSPISARILMHRTRRSPVAFLIAILSIGLLSSSVAASRDPAPTAAPSAIDAAVSNGQVQLKWVAGGLVQPLGIVNAGDGSGRLFIVEKGGTVRVSGGAGIFPGYFLDIRGVIGGFTTGGERGLLGLAFHPSFETNRKLFAYYTNGGGDIVIAEFTANPDGVAVSASTVDSLLTIEHSQYDNHNGGHLMFGPDGYLYAFVGDGGFQNDPYESGQNPNSLLGKALRIAPNLAGGYTIPAGNPFAGGPGADEIWAMGLRNPWKASFDRATNALWIADVGQGSWEEINKDDANAPGRNWGWDCREGSHPFETTGCSGISFSDPVAEYGHGSGDCSVTGGHVYRGSIFEDFVGQYVLGDFCSGRVWTFDANAGLPPPPLQFHVDTGAWITAFGEAENGEIYSTDYVGGILYRVVAPPFRDVLSSGFIDDITWLFYQEITTGCTASNYCPLDNVSREQMASFLVRARNLGDTVNDYFTDDESSPHENDINRLAAAMITTGCSPGLYCPTAPVSREQMASFLARAFNVGDTTTDFFTDDESSPHEHDINRIAAAGITFGCGPGSYCPTALVTREQMAAFLHRAMD